MVRIRGRLESIEEYLNVEKNIIVVYGIGFADYIVREIPAIDYFVDKKAGVIDRANGISVINVKQLEGIYLKENKCITVLIVTEPRYPQVIVHQIYDELFKLKVEANVFDFWGNVYFFNHTSFVYRGDKYTLFENPYNCFSHEMRMSERGVELALMKRYLRDISDTVTEVGAVSPYYFDDEKITEIVDPADEHWKVTNHKSIFEMDLNMKNVMSISTIEHIGTGDYGLEKGESAVDALEKIMRESKSYLVTFPYGYNSELDRWVLDNHDLECVRILSRGLGNDWGECKIANNLPYKYVDAPIYAFGLVVVEKIEDTL